VTRRVIVSGIVTVAIILITAAGIAMAAQQLSIVSWGGAYADSQRHAYFDPYQKLNADTQILLTNAGGDAVPKLREQARAGNVGWDVVDVTAADAIRLCNDGIAQHIDHDKLLAPAPDGTPPSQDFGQTMISECFIPEIVYSTTFAYRADKVDTVPTGLCDVFDLHRFPGKRALEKRPINNLEWALLCDGVPPENVYEVLESKAGVERALHRLDAIKDHVIWWTEGEEPAKLLAKGEVVFASGYNGRFFSMVADPKSRVKMLWDRQIFDFDGWIIPKGAPHQDEAQKFVRFATDTKQLAAQASYIPYGPARRSSAALVGKHATLGIDMAPFMPTAPENAKTAFIYNYDWWANHRDGLDQRFAIWLNEKSGL
jgi:putative spermidine/putrescine transport system substrate-binding protein